MPSNPTDPSFLLKILEIVISIAGLALLHQVHVFYSLWVLHALLLGTGGYLLVCAAIAVCCQFEDFPFFCETLLLSVGWILNFVGGCMVMVRCALKVKDIKWTVVVTPRGGKEDEVLELLLGVVVLVSSLVMFVDFIVVVMNKRASDGEEDE